jgi:hypothetical protein
MNFVLITENEWYLLYKNKKLTIYGASVKPSFLYFFGEHTYTLGKRLFLRDEGKGNFPPLTAHFKAFQG